MHTMLYDISDLIAFPGIFFILTKYQNLCCRIIFIVKEVVLGHYDYLNLITRKCYCGHNMVEAL